MVECKNSSAANDAENECHLLSESTQSEITCLSLLAHKMHKLKGFSTMLSFLFSDNYCIRGRIVSGGTM